MVTFPLASGEAAGNLGDLSEEELDRGRCGLGDHLVEVFVSKFCSRHFGDHCVGRC